MPDFIFSIITQALTFVPLALGISISYHVLRATDMTIDGSFVLGAAVFATGVTHGVSPLLAFACAIAAGFCAGMLAATIQRGGKVDPLLAGVLATFILSSLNLAIMGKPNINLLTQTTLFSSAFSFNETVGWIAVAGCVFIVALITYGLLISSFGLRLRALGDNPTLFKRQGRPIERYRLMGFGFTNALAATAGCITAQTVGYADIGMGLGITLIGIGAIILGQQLIRELFKSSCFRAPHEFIACIIGILLYYSALNALIRFDINPIYLKFVLGILLISFLRAAYITQGERT